MARDGSGIHERGRLRMGQRIRVVSPFRVEGFPMAVFRKDHVGDGDGGQPRGIDERLRRDGSLVAVVGLCGDFPAAAARVDGRDAHDGALEGADAAAVFEVAFEVLHERVAVYDAGRGALEHAGFGADMGFSVLGFALAEEARGHADLLGEVVDAFQGSELRVVLRDDPFARVAVGDVVFGTEFIQEGFASDAEVRLGGIRAVVQSSMDHLYGCQQSVVWILFEV